MESILSENKRIEYIGTVTAETERNDVPLNEKQKILEYLKNGTVHSVAPGFAKDVFSGDRIRGSLMILTDGSFAWRSDTAYYVEKYNIALPEKFIKHILGRS